MKITREGPVKIGIKTIERAWRSRAKDARCVIIDAERPGLALIVNATSMTWSYSYKPRGVNPATGKRFNTTSVMLGSPATLSPDQARLEANKIRDAVATGGDPAAERRAAVVDAARQRASTVECAIADYCAILPMKERKSGGRISEKWVKDQTDHLRRAVAALGIASLPVGSVDIGTVRKLQHGEAYRHRFGALNRFFDWAVHEDRVSINPCASIGRAYRPAAARVRDRTPTLTEIVTMWGAAETALGPTPRDFVRFAICIPARRGEIANLHWEHLDLDARVWRQPSQLTKNRSPHELRLNPLALKIVTRRWEEAGRPKVGLVFPAPRAPTRPISAFSEMLRALHRATPAVERWGLHDLRRSFASTLGKLGHDDDVAIDGVLNHRQSSSRGGVLGTYNRSTRLPAQHAALERWGALVADALEGRFPEEPKVIPLRSRGAAKRD
jgi:integrase